MKLEAFKDYVKADKVTMILDDGVFVGTQNYFFCVPSKISDHTYSKITTTTFSFKGKEIHDAIQDLIDESNSVQELENNLLEMKENFEEMIHHRIDDLSAFKVQAGFLGSGIHIQPFGKKTWRPFIQKLGKEKKEIRAFYENHQKIK